MKIITFFSFKGGVGRTALLENVAAYLASKDRVVAMMDLDLSAPGLSYSIPSVAIADESWSFGISDLFNLFFDNVKKGSSKLHYFDASLLIRAVEFKDKPLKSVNGNLFLIRAGNSHFSIDSKINQENNLMPSIPNPDKDGEAKDQRVSKALAYFLRNDLERWRVPEGKSKGRAIDYLLIDSRTGFAELIDLSLGYLADKMVIVSALNDQNIQGLKYTLRALIEKDRIPLDHFQVMTTLVLSPLPAGEDESMFKRIEEVNRTVLSCLRWTRSGYKEQLPPTFSIHYTPILAMREALLILEQPKSLYAQEILAIANHLEGKELDFDKDAQDDMIKQTQKNLLKIVQKAEPETAAETNKATQKPRIRLNPLADLPPWYWPLPKEEQTEENRLKKLNELMPHNPNVDIDRDRFMNQICWSVFLSKDEKNKVLSSYLTLSQNRVDELSEQLQKEKKKNMELCETKNIDWVLDIYFKSQLEWACLILGYENKGNNAFYEATKDHTFYSWEEIPAYWYSLGNLLKNNLNRYEEAESAYRKAIELPR